MGSQPPQTPKRNFEILPFIRPFLIRIFPKLPNPKYSRKETEFCDNIWKVSLSSVPNLQIWSKGERELSNLQIK
jgi:hypothetical protein